MRGVSRQSKTKKLLLQKRKKKQWKPNTNLSLTIMAEANPITSSNSMVTKVGFVLSSKWAKNEVKRTSKSNSRSPYYWGKTIVTIGISLEKQISVRDANSNLPFFGKLWPMLNAWMERLSSQWDNASNWDGGEMWIAMQLGLSGGRWHAWRKNEKGEVVAWSHGVNERWFLKEIFKKI